MWDWSADTGDDKVKKKSILFENIMVATCGDDGTARLWYPLQVISSLLLSFPFHRLRMFQFLIVSCGW